MSARSVEEEKFSWVQAESIYWESSVSADPSWRMKLRVDVDGLDLAGRAVRVRFHMARKNDFNAIVFLDAQGRAEVEGAVLAREFAADRTTSPMDFVSPAGGFTGRVTAAVMTRDEIGRALAAYELYKGGPPFPAGYLERLRSARELPARAGGRVRVRLLRQERRPRRPGEGRL